MKTIVLTGMMGSGKTSVGKLLAEKISSNFTDIDLEIEKKYGITISEIFAKFGEKYFRKIESEMISDVFKSENTVISLGGGAFQNDKIREFLLNNSDVFYLKTSAQVIFERIKNDKSRPLLCDNMNADKINELIEIRKTNYESAPYTVDTDNLSQQKVVESILGILGNG
ncbi:MAG: shikimate kinase [Candidatus Gastranaerophilaceae bacterium]